MLEYFKTGGASCEMFDTAAAARNPSGREEYGVALSEAVDVGHNVIGVFFSSREVLGWRGSVKRVDGFVADFPQG